MLQTDTTSAWRNFSGDLWKREIDVRDCIVQNLTPYAGGPEFLCQPTAKTLAVWECLKPYFLEEAKKGVLEADATVPSSLTSHGPAYIDRAIEAIVGLQTDKPIRRAIMPVRGYRMVESGLKASLSALTSAVELT